ncbi:hypothetical protein llap_12664 [Limosa lapponica baueri]|uniref:Intersectin-1 n=1 Tax=Limosa lapponica baueri TaxID=1758121 RepID=A0A2I0TTB1_LIMLA|nr:hypothetical protein llap_12664 [Limosa lapponica baueri]
MMPLLQKMPLKLTYVGVIRLNFQGYPFPVAEDRYREYRSDLLSSLIIATGDQARNFFFQSGLPQPVLAQIWALADMNNDGRMDQLEFSIAMKLIKLKLQGYQLPSALPPVMKQPPIALPSAPGFGIGGIASMPSLTTVAPVPMASIPVVGMSPPLVSSVPAAAVPPLANGAPAVIQPLPAFAHPATLPKSSSFSRSGPGSQLNAKLQKAQSFDVASVPPVAEWAVPQSSRLKYRQLFNSHDKTMSGHLTGPQARTILMQSSLPQAQLATIWNLSDIDQDGKLTAEEFILAMHLIDVAMSGQPLPPVLPPEYIPPSFRRVRSGSGISAVSSVSVDQRLPEEPALEEEQQQLEKKLPDHCCTLNSTIASRDLLKEATENLSVIVKVVTFEDKKRENFERGNLELEKRRQALLEQQRKEQERLAQLERAEQERKERERQEQERKRQLELEKQLEKQRELERQREEERRKEIERREAAKRELERQRQLEWERNRRQELLNQRNKEQEDIVVLKAKKKTLEFELEALESQQMLGRLIPEKQLLNDQLKQVQQNSLHRDSLLTIKRALEAKELARQQLRDQLDEVEKETRSKLQEIDIFNNQLKELREIHNKQQLQKQKNLEAERLKQKEQERKTVELEKQKEAQRRIQERDKQRVDRMQPEEELQWPKKIQEDEKQKREEITKKKESDDKGKQEMQEKLSKLFQPHQEPIKPAVQAPWSNAEKAPLTISAQEDVKIVYYRALYPFESRSHDEITIQPGDIVMVDESQTGEPGWLGGELKGKTGWFPANYAEKIPENEVPASVKPAVEAAAAPKVSVHETTTSLGAPASTECTTTANNWADFSSTMDSGSSESPASLKRVASPATKATTSGEEYIAMYTYESSEQGDLTFQQGDMILVTKKDGDWWTGTLGDKSGVFPSNYVRLKDSEVETY